MSINPLDRTFFNHYLLFPWDAPTSQAQKENVFKSLLLGIFTLGILHATCSLLYGIKKLYGRFSVNLPSLSDKISKCRAVVFQQESHRAEKKIGVRDLSEQAICAMTPDQQGELMDRLSRRVKGRSQLTQQQLRGMIRSWHQPTIQIVNKQELGLGHCGRYAINNAFQKDVLSQEDFLRLTGECLMEKLSCSKEEALALINDPESFGIDLGILEYILIRHRQQFIKYRQIHQLPQANFSKQKAMENFLGDATWAIVANVGSNGLEDAIYDMPSSSAAIYPLARGHFVALRKDEAGQWWYLDSRAHAPTPLALAVMPGTCTLIAPV